MSEASEVSPTDQSTASSTETGTRPRVAVIFGGVSSEHGVSCLTASGVLAAIDPARYDVVGIGDRKSVV